MRISARILAPALAASCLLNQAPASAATLSTASVSASGELIVEEGENAPATLHHETEGSASPAPYRAVIESGNVPLPALRLRSEGDDHFREGRNDRAIESYGNSIDAILPGSPPLRDRSSFEWPSLEEFAAETLVATARASLAAGRPAAEALKRSREALAVPFALTEKGTEVRGAALSSTIESLMAAIEEFGGQGDEAESLRDEARGLMTNAVEMGYLSPTYTDGAATRDNLLKMVEVMGYELPSSLPTSDDIAETASTIGDNVVMLIKEAAEIEDFEAILSELRSSMISSLDHGHATVPTPDGKHAIYGATLGYLLSTMENDDSSASSDKESPSLRAFLSVLDVLVDDLGAPIDQRTAGKGAARRPPLHLAARSATPAAVQAMLDKGADPNLRDDEGWTALMATCMVEGKGDDTGPGRVGAARALLDAGARWRDANYEGKTSLHIAAEGLQAPLIGLLLERGADPSLRTAFGQTALGLVQQNAWANRGAAHACAEIISTHLGESSVDVRHQKYMNEEGKAATFLSFLEDTLAGAAEEEASNADEQEARIMAALMRYVEMSPDLLGRPLTEESGNWYGELHSRVLSLIPDAYWRIYRDDSAPTEDESDLITGGDGSAAEEAEVFDYETGVRSIDRSVLLSEAFRPFRERGAYAILMDRFTMLAVTPIQHNVAFAVPSDEALKAIAEHSPLVEVGAGTGYWSAALRSVASADVIAYDPHPPADTNNAHFQKLAYGEVKEGGCAAVFRGDGGAELARSRTLLLVWPNNADAQDNPHLDEIDLKLDIWDVECLEAFITAGGTKVIYVGERREAVGLVESSTAPDWGFTSSRRFQEMLLEKFDLVEKFPCRQWFLNVDDVTVWQKKDVAKQDSVE